MPTTKLNKIVIKKFRALNDVQIELGDHITVICGKNGTSKSSILGIAAQIFNFEKNYENGESLRSYRQITGAEFKSQYSEHFRISEKYDTPGSMTVNVELHDGYTDQSATATLELMRRGKSPRPVVRKNSAATGNTSRNFTHPVIFLSLKRLYPIASRDYVISDFDYLQDHKQEFISLTNELLNRTSSNATGTDGTISSAVAHGENYDHESVSAGEDNAGQIVMALMSFKKLKEEYADYKGGLLLIDEADAGLFPTAQVNLLKMLDRECKTLNLQVVITSHSPILIEYAFERSQHQHSKRFRTVYLSNSYGDVQVMQDWSWSQISADINTKTIATMGGASLPRINVYFEDKEAADFFAALMSRQPIKKFTNPMSEITLGCKNYLQLIHKKIPEFSERSIICLDADQTQDTKGRKLKTVVILPGTLPPDQLIFEHLYNLPANDQFWMNELQFTRDVFTDFARDVIREFAINGNALNLRSRIAAYHGNRKVRDVFKSFYQNADFQKMVSSVTKPYNPWKHWVERNPVASNDFLDRFNSAMYGVMRNGFGVDALKLNALEVKQRNV